MQSSLFFYILLRLNKLLEQEAFLVLVSLVLCVRSYVNKYIQLSIKNTSFENHNKSNLEQQRELHNTALQRLLIYMTVKI